MRLAKCVNDAYNINMKKLLTVVEFKPFIQAAQRVWDETELLEFKAFIAEHYEDGDIISGTGGLRKIRWSRQGMGKRGGVRVIYYFYDEDVPVYLIYAYPKNELDNLTSDDKKAFAEVVGAIKVSIKSKRGGKNGR